jgi:CubicO group peptidase (beta-lactamase class C family)
VKTSLRRRLLTLATLIVFGAACGFAQSTKSTPAKPAEDSKAPAAAEAATKGHELTAVDLEAFLDGFVPEQIEHADIAGTVIAVVKDGKLLFAKGYGYADAAKKIPVSPETTLFRPGSISKLFTWTAVLQQVEQGKLDLDRDVNDYLDFKIPPAFGKPITLRNIMTHSTGFEETLKELFVGSAKDLKPISEYLRLHLPARIFSPGTTPAYSNYATTMAGYIVQRISGQPFDDYIDEHLLKPLNMPHATFRQPLPENLKPLMLGGYIRASEGAKPFEFVEAAPAGALSASAVDMTHFMIAHLQNGRYGDVQILKPETAIEMHSRQQGWPPAMNAMALGFYEESRNGHRIIGHGGDTVYFHSDLHLILDTGVGFFVSYNSAGRDQINLRGILFDKFMDRYFPDPEPTGPAIATAAQDSQAVAGLYKVSRRFETNLLSVTTLIGETKVYANPKDNTVSIDIGFFKRLNGEPIHYREIAPFVFRAVDGHEKVAFVNDPTGRRVAYIDFPFMVFQQVNETLDKKPFNYVVIFFSLGVVLLNVLFWPIAAILRKHYSKPLTLNPSAMRWRLLVRIVCFFDLAFVLILLLLAGTLNSPGALGPQGDAKLHLIQVIGLIGGLGSILAIFACVKSWFDSQQWVWYRIWNTLLAIGCVGFFWFLWHWHLLNFHLNY